MLAVTINCGFSWSHLALHVSVIHEEATALRMASKNGHMAVVQLILSHGAKMYVGIAHMHNIMYCFLSVFSL